MRTIRFTSKFKKDYKRIKRRGKDQSHLRDVVELLANDQTLPSHYRDHDLIGDYVGTRECHIEPDWLLIYQFQGETELILVRTGSHSDLFR